MPTMGMGGRGLLRGFDCGSACGYDYIDPYCHKFFRKVGQPFSSAFPKAELVPNILAVNVPPSA